MKWAIRIWVGAAIVLPALIGLVLLFAPLSMASADSPMTTQTALAGTIGTRDLVYSAMLVAAAFLLGARAVGVLLIGRGLIDLVDGLRAMVLAGFVGPAFMPIFFAILSFVVGFLLLRRTAATASKPEPL